MLSLKKLREYKLIKYLRIFLDKKYIVLITISALISNMYILYLNSKYNNFYENPPATIQAEAIVVRRLSRKRIYKYVYNKNKIR